MKECSLDGPPCYRCACLMHQAIYEKTGQWFCTFHMRNNEPTPVSTPLQSQDPEGEPMKTCDNKCFDEYRCKCMSHEAFFKQYGVWYCTRHFRTINNAIIDASGERKSVLLTDAEREIIRKSGELWTDIVQAFGEEQSRSEELRDLAYHIHAIQRAIGAQAAARAYPGEFWPLGEMIEENR